MSALGQRLIRREMDRLAGEIIRRQGETEACLVLYARREGLRNVRCGVVREARALARWVVA